VYRNRQSARDVCRPGTPSMQLTVAKQNGEVLCFVTRIELACSSSGEVSQVRDTLSPCPFLDAYALSCAQSSSMSALPWFQQLTPACTSAYNLSFWRV